MKIGENCCQLILNTNRFFSQKHYSTLNRMCSLVWYNCIFFYLRCLFLALDCYSLFLGILYIHFVQSLLFYDFSKNYYPSTCLHIVLKQNWVESVITSCQTPQIPKQPHILDALLYFKGFFCSSYLYSRRPKLFVFIDKLWIFLTDPVMKIQVVLHWTLFSGLNFPGQSLRNILAVSWNMCYL